MAEEPDTQNTRWLRPFLRPMMGTFREVLVMSGFVNLIALATPVFTMQVYDRVVFKEGISTLWGLVIGMVLVILFDLILKMTRARIMQSVALKADVEVGRKLFDKLMALPLSELESKPASHWQALFRDVDTVRNVISGATAVLAVDLPFVFLFLILLIVIAPAVTPVLLVILPLFMFVAWRSGNVMAQANQEERQSNINRDELIAEMLAGRTTIKALALDRAMRPVWEERHADNIRQSMERGMKTDFYSNVGGAITMGTTLMITTVGALAIVEQELTMGALIAANMLSGRLLGPLNQLVQQWRNFNQFKQAVSRLGETFNTPGERQESEVAMTTPCGELLVENVTFSYAAELKPVLNGVTCTLRAGGVHALVGRNGSGKTTLLKMLQGLYRPTQGRVLIDGADIAQFTRAELADWMGYVPQECVLFAGTIRDNITHRNPKASDNEVIKAAKAAGVHQFIIDLPDGYASDIGEAGRRLSGGQRQRIAIARALIGDPCVLMMDEPSASLDRQAEQALRATLKELSRTRSVILVTHSPILLAACDDLIALDHGHIALAGPAAEILPKMFGQQPMQAPPASGEPAAKPGEKPAAKAARAKASAPPAQKPPPRKPAPRRERLEQRAPPPKAAPRQPVPDGALARIAPRKIPAGQAKPATPVQKPPSAPPAAAHPPARPAPQAVQPARPAPQAVQPAPAAQSTQPAKAAPPPPSPPPAPKPERAAKPARTKTNDPYHDILSGLSNEDR